MSHPREQTVYYHRARFTTHLPLAFRYSPAHYWLSEQAPGVWTVGFTRFATRMLGDLVEFMFPLASGAAIEVGSDIGSVEGMKAVTTVFSCGRGAFLEANGRLSADITLVESDPYGAGWLYRLRGEPASDTVDVHGYISLLDLTVDKMLSSRHGAAADE
jgi:glycine cleavage system H protein